MRLRAQGAEHRAQSTGRRAQGAEHRAQSTEHRAQSTEHRAQGTGHWAEERQAASGTREEHETCSLDVRRNTQKKGTARPQDNVLCIMYDRRCAALEGTARPQDCKTARPQDLSLPLSKNPPQTMGDLGVDFPGWWISPGGFQMLFRRG